MTLIKSISGIRGTIGGAVGEGLTPLDVVKFISAYAAWIKNRQQKSTIKVVLGRDARISGEMVEQLTLGTLSGMGVNVVNLGLATTPTVEVMVTHFGADGGLILTASHNPKQWNALKMLNEKGEFLSSNDGKEILEMANSEAYLYADVDDLGVVENFSDHHKIHIQQILELPTVNFEAIKKANFKVAIDCVNSVGGVVLPLLLKELGVLEVIELYTTPNGHFPHNPEPLPEHLTEISETVRKNHCHVGFVVDPDVDRLAIVSEDGSMFGEEYTLVAIADYLLPKNPGATVSNLSSSRALRDVTQKFGQNYYASAVGEVNVVEKMKATNAVFGGEGNGGVIYPELHYGRDSLVGIALFLSHLAEQNCKCSILRKSYPEYYMSKNKIELTPNINVDSILEAMKQIYSKFQVTDIDGVKIDFDNEWVHLRKSNTEPIIRIYSESVSPEAADQLCQKIISKIKELSK